MKTTTIDGERLREAIAARDDKRKTLDADLRVRAAAYARRRTADGATRSAIASELGVSTVSVSRWLKTTTRAALVPVRVVAEPTAPSPCIEVVTPRGLRVVGLDLDAVCMLLARHG